MGFYVVQALTGLASASALFLAAAGLSIIFGVTRIVNFAHGVFYMLGAYMAWTLTSQFGDSVLGFWLALVVASLSIGVVGLLVELTVLRRIYQAPELFQLTATFGVFLILQDVTLAIWGPEDLLGPRAPLLDGSVTVLGHPLPSYDLALIVLGPLVLAGLWFLFYRTRWGALVRAATEDREMLGALGVNQRLLFSTVFFLGTALAAFGGAAQLPKGGADLLMGLNILASVFVVVVVGGMGSIPGAFLAALLIAQLNAFGILIFPQGTLVLMFLVMAVVLVIRPKGLLGKAEGASRIESRALIEAAYPAPGLWERSFWALAITALALLPLAGDAFALVLTKDILLFVLLAASLHFLLGPGGLVSFGHAAFFGCGAYAAALLVTYAESSMVLALLLAPLLAGCVAVIVGWFCVRLSGVYFAMLTLAFAQVLWSIVFQWTSVTGGDDGLLGVWPDKWANDDTVFYYLVTVLAIGGILLLRQAVHSPFGFATRAGRDSMLRAEALGLHVKQVQHVAMVFAGALAGLAGALYAFSKGSAFPDYMGIEMSFDSLIAVMLGGVQSLLGPLFGAGLFSWAAHELSTLSYWRGILGLLIVVLVLAFPRGLAGIPAAFRAVRERLA